MFSGVSQTHRIAQEEIFGPVVSVLTFRTPAEAVAKANNTPYGLSAGIWTEKGSRILWMADQLRAGVVWANTFNKFDPTSPFGGYKESGYGREGGRHGLEAYVTTGGAQVSTRVDVRKTYKLYIGGKFPRSESGRSYEVYAAPSGAAARRGSASRAPKFLANAAQGSRKDARDAVVAARKAQPGWAGATAYNRGQVLYRVAEVMESRRAQLVQDVRDSEGLTAARAEVVVSEAIDRWVWYAGWSDKFTQVLGGLNPVAGPYFDISAPEATGVVAVLAPQASSLLGLVSVVAPVIVSGNTAVVLTSEDRPLPAITLAECLATSDVPGGVVNIVTGRTGRDGARGSPATATSTPSTSPVPRVPRASTGVRWRRPRPRTSSACCAPAAPASRRSSPTSRRRPTSRGSRAFLETKTVWHPKGR